MTSTYVALDSRAGTRPIREALRHLRTRFGEVAVSPTYRIRQATGEPTETLHLVVAANSILPLSALLRELKNIGEVVNQQTAPPALDVTLLLLGSAVLKDGPYELPHPALPRRREWLIALAEVEPGLHHPALGERFSDMADSLGRSGVLPYDYPIT